MNINILENVNKVKKVKFANFKSIVNWELLLLNRLKSNSEQDRVLDKVLKQKVKLTVKKILSTFNLL